MNSARIPPLGGATVPGPISAQQVDLQQQVKQVQHEDQLELAVESEQIAGLKSDMDVTADQDPGRGVIGKQQPRAKETPSESSSNSETSSHNSKSGRSITGVNDSR